MSCIIQEIIKYFEQGRDDLMDEADKHAINTVKKTAEKDRLLSLTCKFLTSKVGQTKVTPSMK